VSSGDPLLSDLTNVSVGPTAHVEVNICSLQFLQIRVWSNGCFCTF